LHQTHFSQRPACFTHWTTAHQQFIGQEFLVQAVARSELTAQNHLFDLALDHAGQGVGAQFGNGNEGGGVNCHRR
jgi:hypothetical protein